MAGVYRAMIAENGMPVVGAAAKMLGARPNFDIPVELDKTVKPRTGGLSICIDWRSLPSFLIPRRLQPIVNDARGNNDLACFRLRDCDFAESKIDELLVLRIDSATHGTIEPIRQMYLEDFQSGLAATREKWVVDEK